MQRPEAPSESEGRQREVALDWLLQKPSRSSEGFSIIRTNDQPRVQPGNGFDEMSGGPA
jgi:hypothetical protein